jgi:hypothetical protein
METPLRTKVFVTVLHVVAINGESHDEHERAVHPRGQYTQGRYHRRVAPVSRGIGCIVHPETLPHGRSIKLEGYAKESTIVLGSVFLQFRNHRATRLGLLSLNFGSGGPKPPRGPPCSGMPITPPCSSLLHPSTNGMMSSRLGTITVPVRYASGPGSGWKPILVTTSKFLPEQAIYVSAHAVAYSAHVFAFGRAPGRSRHSGEPPPCHGFLSHKRNPTWSMTDRHTAPTCWRRAGDCSPGHLRSYAR